VYYERRPHVPSQNSILKNNWKWQARKNRNNGTQGARDYALLLASEAWEKKIKQARRESSPTTDSE
jgi:hypothetical protein